VRVPPKVMATSRKSARTYGKSDSIDALAVAAPHSPIRTFPARTEDAAATELKLLSDHRANLIHERSTAQDRLRWHLRDLWPELQIPPGGLDREKWLERVSRRLGRSQAGARVRIMRQLVRVVRGGVPYPDPERLANASRLAPTPHRRQQRRLEALGDKVDLGSEARRGFQLPANPSIPADPGPIGPLQPRADTRIHDAAAWKRERPPDVIEARYGPAWPTRDPVRRRALSDRRRDVE
jgi:hypothetical protein